MTSEVKKFTIVGHKSSTASIFPLQLCGLEHFQWLVSNSSDLGRTLISQNPGCFGTRLLSNVQ